VRVLGQESTSRRALPGERYPSPAGLQARNRRQFLQTVLQPTAPAHGSPTTAQCHGSASQSEYIARRLTVSAFRACAGPRPGEHFPKSLTLREVPLAGRPSSPKPERVSAHQFRLQTIASILVTVRSCCALVDDMVRHHGCANGPTATWPCTHATGCFCHLGSK
jgi:hypothetical protein